MEAAPPSYETATLTNAWDLIAPHLSTPSLCAAARVNSAWHATFTPHIWGHPASHFGSAPDDAVYVALTRFKRTLPTARLLVRACTHTLHLPPAHAELYEGPHADWLREILERLPGLQSLIVRGLPFFDHAALLALRLRVRRPEALPDGVVELPGTMGMSFQAPSNAVPSFGLRLLNASRCPNVTADGLASALRRFEGLLYLDLSFTPPARDALVLDSLRNFQGLQVLKLRGIGLRDDGIEKLTKAIGLRVRSLDVRDNFITDRGVRLLLDRCFSLRTHSNHDGHLPSGQRSPALLPYLGTEMLGVYQGEDFEGFIRNTFTGRFVSRLAIEDAPPGGLTHLYIAGNELTVEGISGLVRSERMHVLDVAGSSIQHPSLAPDGSGACMAMPGMAKLTPVLAKHAAGSMTFLRCHHSIVTQQAPRSCHDEVVPGRVELDDMAVPDFPSYAAELDGRTVEEEAFELPDGPQTPRYELAGDPLHFVVSPAVNEAPHLEPEEEAYDSVKRGSSYAPEVVEPLTSSAGTSSLLSPTSSDGNAPRKGNGKNITSPSSPFDPEDNNASRQRPRSYSNMATERNARLNAHRAAGHGLHPAMLPHVKTLVLTDVPSSSPHPDIANRIIAFVKNCAAEAALARQLAKLDYALPPGRRGLASALKQSADKILALQRLVIELAAKPDARRNVQASTSWQHQETKSMTEDRDTEALWSAADTDFSFFGEEECGLPTVEPGRSAFYSGSNEKQIAGTGSMWTGAVRAPVPHARMETVALLSAFRKERKLAHQRHIDAGNPEAETEGYWEGVVQVVYPTTGLRNDEELDYYGNKFTNEYLYR